MLIRISKTSSKSFAYLDFQVRAHILSFPRQTSHYSQKRAPNKRFLREDLSVNRMYHLYLETNERDMCRRQQEILRYFTNFKQDLRSDGALGEGFLTGGRFSSSAKNNNNNDKNYLNTAASVLCLTQYRQHTLKSF